MIKEKYIKNIYKIILVFISGIIIGSFSILPMILIQKVIDSLYIRESELFIKYILLYAFIYIVVDSLKILIINIATKFELNLNKKIKEDIVDHILGARIDLLSEYGHSNVFNTIIDDIKDLDNKLIPLVFGLGFSISSFIIGVFIIIKYDSIMLFAILCISITSTILIKKILDRSDMAVRKSKHQRLYVINRLYDIIVGARDIKLFQKEDVFKKEFHRDNSTLYDYDKKIINIKNSSQTLISLLFNIIMATLILIGGFRVSKGNLSVGALVAIILYASMITDPIFNIMDNQKEISTFKNSIKRLDVTFLNIRKEAVYYQKEFNTIEFRNIHLYYGDTMVLNDFNDTIYHGDKIKITGRTGSGKSSLVKLLTNSYKPSLGSILIDGKEDVFVSVAVVFQENKLFNTSILDNITFKTENKNLQKIIEICRLEEVISKYRFNDIGFDASTLSGGEKTRLLIARALCKDSELYIFDEISTGIDEDLFYELFDDLMEFLKNKTVIVIEHKYLDSKYFNKFIDLGVIC